MSNLQITIWRDQNKWRCDICGKGFSNNQRLVEHIHSPTTDLDKRFLTRPKTSSA